MKLAKKLLALALAGALALTVLTGCGDSVRQAFKREVGAASVKAYPGLTTQQLDNAIRAAKAEVANTVKWDDYKDVDNAANKYEWAQQEAFWTKFNEVTGGLLKKGIEIRVQAPVPIAPFYMTIISVYRPAGVKDAARKLMDNLGKVGVQFDDKEQVDNYSYDTTGTIIKNNPDALKDKNIYLAWSTEPLPEYFGKDAGERLVILGGPDLTYDWFNALS